MKNNTHKARTIKLVEQIDEQIINYLHSIGRFSVMEGQQFPSTVQDLKDFLEYIEKQN